MNASYSKYTSTHDDYNLHGDIVHNMRECAKSRGIPILTITQNNRGSEDRDVASNNDVGGSIKKVRYCDLLIQIKQDDQIGINDPQLALDVGMAALTNNKAPISIEQDVIPFKVTITKNKNGNRGASKYHMFSKTNIKIYQEAVLYHKDLVSCVKRSKDMVDKLEALEFSNSEDIDDMVNFSEMLGV
jgi:hypothetical protein